MKNNKRSIKNKPFTPAYVLFYLIFSEDTWRLGFGGLFAYIFAPSVLATREVQLGGIVLVYLMLICIGWWAFAYPAKKITQILMTWIRKRNP